MRVHAEIVNGVCPTCTEFTMLVGVTKTFYRCMNCGADLEQYVNGKISYIPHIHDLTLQSKLDEYFKNEE